MLPLPRAIAKNLSIPDGKTAWIICKWKDNGATNNHAWTDAPFRFYWHSYIKKKCLAVTQMQQLAFPFYASEIKEAQGCKCNILDEYFLEQCTKDKKHRTLWK